MCQMESQYAGTRRLIGRAGGIQSWLRVRDYFVNGMELEKSRQKKNSKRDIMKNA